MVNLEATPDIEETPLMSSRPDGEHLQRTLPISANPNLSPHRVLPVAFLSAIAMSSTAATAYYAYASLLCRDPSHCEGDETSRYAGFVAVTTCVSNTLGVIALGPLQTMVKKHRILGIVLWQGTRSMSPIMLLTGVYTRNIYIAFSGRIFDGFASDNLLHFILNTVYALSTNSKTSSSMIGYSLALYMTGISISPFVAGLFGNFTTSFIMAIGLFTITIAYVLVWAFPRSAGRRQHYPHYYQGNSTGSTSGESTGTLTGSFLAPLRILIQSTACSFCGLSLLIYNMVQSYTFSALLVHTSVRFRFTGKQNGLILTIAHSVAALYIFMVLYIIPRSFPGSKRCAQSSDHVDHKRPRIQDGFRAIFSLSLQALSLLTVGLATQPRHIYVASGLLALGLPTPSFMKAFVVSLLEGSQRGEALAALAAMEVLGDVFGPVVLGTWQSYSSMGGVVFFGASGIIVASLLLFTLATIMVKWEIKQQDMDPEETLQQ